MIINAGNKKIIVAEYSGYCFGVKRSIDLAEALLKDSDKPIYACGPLIHNESVMRELAQKGLRFIDTPEEADSEGILIIRSHGAGQDFYSQLKDINLAYSDSTCPYVKRIHSLVHSAHADGYKIIIAGDPNHPEVIGINGWCGNSAMIISDIDEAPGIAAVFKDEMVLIVAQTTLIKDKFDELCRSLLNLINNVTIRNTICDITTKRQKSCETVAIQTQLMLILGGKSSSNSKKLLEVAKKICKNSYLIENIEDLPLKEIQKCNTIGIAAGASTPVHMIKEVIATMTVNTENTEKNSMDDFMEEIEKSLRLPRTGEIVIGTVVQVSNRDVIVNLGCKKDGVIPRDEINLEPEKTIPDMFKEGDEVQAKVLKTDDGEGNILLSKKKVVINEHWEDINRAHEEKSAIEAKVIKEVNGGVIAVFKEIYGFIPLSQLSDRYVDKADEFIGKVLPVKVTRVDQKRNKVVFSHKSVLAEERQKKLEKIWSSINIGDVIDGTVMRFTEYGAFVDIGGIDGLLHISEISWGKLRHPKEVLEIGQKIPVKILSIVKEKEKISLGYKQNLPEPWSIIDEKYSIGQIVKGKAVQIKDYGAFVELEPGLDGLVHISEIAYKRVNNISDELSVGQEVTAKILEIDKGRKRISLSIKETAERPSDDESGDGVTEGLKDSAVTAEDVKADEETKASEIRDEAAPVTEAVVADDPAVVVTASDPSSVTAGETTDAAESVGETDDAVQTAETAAVADETSAPEETPVAITTDSNEDVPAVSSPDQNEGPVAISAADSDEEPAVAQLADTYIEPGEVIDSAMEAVATDESVAAETADAINSGEVVAELSAEEETPVAADKDHNDPEAGISLEVTVSSAPADENSAPTDETPVSAENDAEATANDNATESSGNVDKEKDAV